MLTNRDEFRFLVDLVLQHASADHTCIVLHDQHNGTSRFANNQIIQNLNLRKASFSITSALGLRHGTASTTDLTAGSVKETLKQAEGIARISPDDPEFLPPVEPQTFQTWPTFRPDTLAAGPARRAALVRESVDQCQTKGLKAAGIVASSTINVGIAASTGLFAHEQRTDSRFSLTAQAGESTGWTAAWHRSIDHLHVSDRTRVAIEKATSGENPEEILPGRYTVILEPPAVAGLLSWFIWMLDAKSYDKGTSPFAGMLNKSIVDQRLTLRNWPGHPDLLGEGFTNEGLPVNEMTWIESGVLKQLDYDRFTARQHDVVSIPTLESPCLTGDTSACADVNELIRQTTRGVLVTNFWYIRPVNPTDLTLTGMTRDGTFLIEDGRITKAIRNFRFHDSPLRIFNQIEAFTSPQEATSSETGKLLVPAMKIRDFNFSSVTKF
jgi:predicted Zn-dependent protease